MIFPPVVKYEQKQECGLNPREAQRIQNRLNYVQFTRNQRSAHSLIPLLAMVPEIGMQGRINVQAQEAARFSANRSILHAYVHALSNFITPQTKYTHACLT